MSFSAGNNRERAMLLKVAIAGVTVFEMELLRGTAYFRVGNRELFLARGLTSWNLGATGSCGVETHTGDVRLSVC